MNDDAQKKEEENDKSSMEKEESSFAKATEDKEDWQKLAQEY